MCHYFRQKALFPCLWYCPAWQVSLFQCLLYCLTWCVLISVPAVLSDMMCPYFHACGSVRHDVSLFQCLWYCLTWHVSLFQCLQYCLTWCVLISVPACCVVWHGMCRYFSAWHTVRHGACPHFSAWYTVRPDMCPHFSAWCSQTCIHFSLPCSFVQHNNINVMHCPSAVNGSWQLLHIVTSTAYSHLAFQHTLWCNTTNLWRDRPCDVTQQTCGMTDPVR